MIELTGEPFDAAARLGGFAERGGEAGAIASFIGAVRGPATALELEHHPSFTRKVVERIVADARARFDLVDVLVVHRFGRMLRGEPIVLVAAAAAHRRAAFDAVDYLMDRLKVEAPFWKREEGPGDARWIEPRARDRADRQRWEPNHAD